MTVFSWKKQYAIRLLKILAIKLFIHLCWYPLLNRDFSKLRFIQNLITTQKNKELNTNVFSSLFLDLSKSTPHDKSLSIMGKIFEIGVIINIIFERKEVFYEVKNTMNTLIKR